MVRYSLTDQEEIVRRVIQNKAKVMPKGEYPLNLVELWTTAALAKLRSGEHASAFR